jgi:uracil phosphoribosyltransferase
MAVKTIPNLPNLRICDHPMVLHWLGVLRDAQSERGFRDTLDSIAPFLVYEALADLPKAPDKVRTPMDVEADWHRVDVPIVLIPIIRAGMIMEENVWRHVPNSSTAHVLVQRDKQANPVRGKDWFGEAVDGSAWHLILETIIATAGSVDVTARLVKELGGKKLIAIAPVIAREGAEMLLERHPDMLVYGAALDEGMTEKKYVVPGFGDGGQRGFNSSY